MNRLFCRSALVLALCALSTGCITTAEQQARHNGERCVARGYQPNTKEFDDCLRLVESDRSARIESNRREMTERSAVPSSNRGY